MLFLNPALLIVGLSAASLPIVVHFLTRPRPVRMPLSTIRLVSDALQERKSRHRLRDWLVLLVRCGAVGLLAVAMARPLLMSQQELSSEATAEVVKVVLLDASQSMAAIDGATARFDEAKAAAAKHLSHRANLAANLFIAGSDPGAVFDSPSVNLRLLLQRLSASTPSATAIDVPLALETAARQLAEAPESAKLQLVVISDFQRANWARADFRVLPQHTQVNLVSVGGESAPANVAIESVRLSTTPTAGKQLTLLVDVANHGDDPRTIKCRLDMQSLAQDAAATVAAHATETLSMPLLWPTADWFWGEVRLVDHEDALPADDAMPIVVGVRPANRIVIVTEASQAHRGGAYFFKQMLATDLQGDADVADATDTVIISPSDLTTPIADAAGVWIMTEMESWGATMASRVASWLRRGGGLLYVARKAADANNLSMLRQAMGSELQPPVELIASLESETRTDLSIESIDTQMAPFNLWGDQAVETLRGWKIAGGLPTERLSGGSVDAIAATLDDRSTLLFFADAGAGRMAVLNADLARSNIAYHAGFVPMIIETIGRITATNSSIAPAIAGQAIVRELPIVAGEPGELTIKRVAADADETLLSGKVLMRDQGFVWSWPSPDRAGVYRVQNAAGTTVWAEAIRSDPIEQDLRSLSADVLQSRLAGGRDIRYRNTSQPADKSDTLWVWAVLAMLGCIVVEFWTLFAFRS